MLAGVVGAGVVGGAGVWRAIRRRNARRRPRVGTPSARRRTGGAPVGAVGGAAVAGDGWGVAPVKSWRAFRLRARADDDGVRRVRACITRR